MLPQMCTILMHFFIYTCTVSQITGCWLSELIDVIVAQALLDFDGGGMESTASFVPSAADIAGHNTIPDPWMRPGQPQRGVGATVVHRDAPLRHLQTFTLVEKTVPPSNRR